MYEVFVRFHFCVEEKVVEKITREIKTPYSDSHTALVLHQHFAVCMSSVIITAQNQHHHNNPQTIKASSRLSWSSCLIEAHASSGRWTTASFHRQSPVVF